MRKRKGETTHNETCDMSQGANGRGSQTTHAIRRKGGTGAARKQTNAIRRKGGTVAVTMLFNAIIRRRQSVGAVARSRYTHLSFVNHVDAHRVPRAAQHQVLRVERPSP